MTSDVEDDTVSNLLECDVRLLMPFEVEPLEGAWVAEDLMDHGKQLFVDNDVGGALEAYACALRLLECGRVRASTSVAVSSPPPSAASTGVVTTAVGAAVSGADSSSDEPRARVTARDVCVGARVLAPPSASSRGLRAAVVSYVDDDTVDVIFDDGDERDGVLVSEVHLIGDGSGIMQREEEAAAPSSSGTTGSTALPPLVSMQCTIRLNMARCCLALRRFAAVCRHADVAAGILGVDDVPVAEYVAGGASLLSDASSEQEVEHCKRVATVLYVRASGRLGMRNFSVRATLVLWVPCPLAAADS